MMDRRTLVKDLIALTGRSASSLATEIGINRSGVTHWLKHGGTSTGIEKQNELLEKLGVFRGSLDPDRVHFWTLKSGGLSSLVRILSWTGGPYEMFLFYLDDYAFISDDRLMALCDSGRKIQIVLRRKLDPLDPTGVGEVLDVLVREGLVQSPVFQAICLGSETSGRWISGNVSVEEFDRILGLGEGTTSEEKSPWRASMTWEDFNREMERRGLRPEEALDLIDRGKERSQ